MSIPEMLGRSVVVGLGGPVPERWRSAPEIPVTRDARRDELSATVERLHSAWVTREPVVIRLDLTNEELAEPQTIDVPLWDLEPGFTFLRERLHHLVWANSYDARGDGLRWWWAVKAEALGANPGGSRDVVLPDGTEAWVDGGPRQMLDVEEPVVHSESIVLGRLTRLPAPATGAAEGLAPDQREAVLHRAGAARVIAPAGSGKTRTLMARVRHLIDDRAVEPDTIMAVAYNRRAAEDLAERLGVRGVVRTIHSLGRAIVHDAKGEMNLLSERDVRQLLDPIVQVVRRPNTDVIGPFVEALSDVRIALRSPTMVEAERDDVPGLADVFARYRRTLASRRAVDQDEYIFGAIEALVSDAELRARWQRRCRHLLVDEFQDLTPGYLLLLRLVASPSLDVFGVGDDDQVIYGYAGADPGFLIDFDTLFPASGHHALETNYRCPVRVVESASTLLSYTRRRVDKVIRPAADASDTDSDLDVRLVPGATAASEVGDILAGWSDEGVADSDAVVLCRVNSALLPVHAALVEAGRGVRSPVGPAVLGRTVMSAALAWMRIGADPDVIVRSDLLAAVKRPSRGLNRVAAEALGSRRSVRPHDLREISRTLDGRRRDRWDAFCGDIEAVAEASTTGDTREVVEVLAHRVGLDRAAAALDAGRSRADRSGQSDDLHALIRLAALHPRLDDFEEWLRRVVVHPDADGGVLLTTVHRVKGLEWDRVVVYGADAGLMPHSLATDLEEERRVFHVALTRARRQVVIVADEKAPSRFIRELDGSAARDAEPQSGPARRVDGVPVMVGQEVAISGGYTGVVGRLLPIGILVELRPGPGRVSVPWGETISTGGRTGPLRPGSVEADPGLVERLKEWRRRLAQAQGVPAYIILNDSSIEELAARRPRSEEELLSVRGIGPARLEAYGDELLDIVGSD